MVATDAGGPQFLGKVFDGYEPASTSMPPLGTITRVSTLEACNPVVRDGAKVVTVLGSETKLLAGLYTYDQEDLLGKAETFIKLYRQEQGGSLKRATRFIGPPDAHKFKLIDVAVTDTSAPLHLVFQSPYGHRLFNLHLAEGVTLSGVTLLGGEASAVANLPAGVPVEAMTSEQLVACDAGLRRAPRNGLPLDDPAFPPTWSQEVQDKWTTRHDEIEAYNSWFASRFGGVRSDETLRGYDQGHATLVGGPCPPRLPPV